ncbi:MAG: cytochrome-c peroxidase [Gemmatimonadales bacterium]
MRSIIAILTLTAALACGEPTEPPEPSLNLDAELRQLVGGWGVVPIGPMPEQPVAMVELGRALFFDKLLSGNRDIACASCHLAAASLGDGLSLAVGTGGTGLGASRALGAGREFVPRNAPSLLNAGLGMYQMFWDARLSGTSPGPFQVDSAVALPAGLPNLLSAQAMLPVLNRREMRGEPGDVDAMGNPNELAAIADGQPAQIWAAVMTRLLAVPEYVSLFHAAFPSLGAGAPRFEHAAQALATFQRQAFTHTRSPFDRWLERDDLAMTADQKRGGILFFGRARCSQCHNGPFLGAQQFANIGAPQIGPGGRREASLDLGRGELEGFDFYRFAFRVAPLRNVELTAPYMHSGAYATLEAVVRHYNDVPEALATYDPSQLAPAFRGLLHLDQATIADQLQHLDFRVRTPLGLSDEEVGQLVEFLKALTDPAARDLGSVVPARVPSGLAVPR